MVQIFRISYDLFKDAAEFSTVYFHVNAQNDGYTLGTGNSKVVYSARIKTAGEIGDFAATLEPNAILVDIEADVEASPTIVQTGLLQKQFDFTTSFIFIGTAKLNTLTSTVGWTIQRFSLDSSGDVTEKRITFQDTAIWDNKASELFF